MFALLPMAAVCGCIHQLMVYPVRKMGRCDSVDHCGPDPLSGRAYHELYRSSRYRLGARLQACCVPSEVAGSRMLCKREGAGIEAPMRWRRSCGGAERRLSMLREKCVAKYDRVREGRRICFVVVFLMKKFRYQRPLRD